MTFLPKCNNNLFPEYFTMEDLEELPQMIRKLKRNVGDLSKIPPRKTPAYEKRFKTLVLDATGICGIGQGIIDQIKDQVEKNDLQAAQRSNSILKRNAKILSIHQAMQYNLFSICTLFQMHQQADEEGLKRLIGEQIQLTMKWNMSLLGASFSEIYENMLDFSAIEYSRHESMQAAVCVNGIERILTEEVGEILEKLVVRDKNS